jgi:hypothetical protein
MASGSGCEPEDLDVQVGPVSGSMRNTGVFLRVTSFLFLSSLFEALAQGNTLRPTQFHTPGYKEVLQQRHCLETFTKRNLTLTSRIKVSLTRSCSKGLETKQCTMTLFRGHVGIGIKA